MRVTVLDGWGADNAPMKVLLEEEMKERAWQVDSFVLRNTKVGGCMGCFGCWVKTPGICVINDAGRDIARLVIRSDLLLLVTPVTFGGYSSELKKAVDRLIPLNSPFFKKISGEIHHKPRYGRYPSLLAIGSLPDRDEENEQIFRTLVKQNAINFHSPAFAAGFLYGTQTPQEMRETIHTLLSEGR
ncbi:MAG TPA: NAD(P)H-dependent oxidoreductase [Thermodesulfovibrionales bacterium]|nr:NAD(P)H-dependent oxidoreductase [Thermodesulfovibrionales bacterium]